MNSGGYKAAHYNDSGPRIYSFSPCHMLRLREGQAVVLHSLVLLAPLNHALATFPVAI